MKGGDKARVHSRLSRHWLSIRKSCITMVELQERGVRYGGKKQRDTCGNNECTGELRCQAFGCDLRQ
jgi:hypothetical protein